VNKLLILSGDAPRFVSLIEKQKLQNLDIQACSEVSDGIRLVADRDIILGEPPMIRQVLHAANQLKWVQSCWAGVDAFCQPGLRQDYILTGVTGQFGNLISEYVMGYLFALERQFFQMHSNQLEKHWQPLPYRRPQQLTLGIVGLGSIGQHLAKIADGFGFCVTGLSRSGAACELVEKVYTSDHLDEFLGAADYVVVTLPGTQLTRHMVNQSFLQLMKPSAVLMNVGRGSVVDEKALIEALQHARIRAAVLDVFETEPLPPDSPLWTLPNVIVTPHVSAVSFPEDIAGVFQRNYQRYLRAEALQHVVDFERGY
jgi:phosphoglycerate dehydrogenase-like enzyme